MSQFGIQTGGIKVDRDDVPPWLKKQRIRDEAAKNPEQGGAEPVAVQDPDPAMSGGDYDGQNANVFATETPDYGESGWSITGSLEPPFSPPDQHAPDFLKMMGELQKEQGTERREKERLIREEKELNVYVKTLPIDVESYEGATTPDRDYKGGLVGDSMSGATTQKELDSYRTAELFSEEDGADIDPNAGGPAAKEPDFSADANRDIEDEIGEMGGTNVTGVPGGVGPEGADQELGIRLTPLRRLDSIMTKYTSQNIPDDEYEYIKSLERSGELDRIDKIRRKRLLEATHEVMEDVYSYKKNPKLAEYDKGKTVLMSQHRDVTEDRYEGRKIPLGHVGSGAIDIAAASLGTLVQQEEFMKRMKDLGYHVIDERTANSHRKGGAERSVIHVSMLPHKVRKTQWVQDRYLVTDKQRKAGKKFVTLSVEEHNKKKKTPGYKAKRVKYLLDKGKSFKQIKEQTGYRFGTVKTTTDPLILRKEGGKNSAIVGSLPKDSSYIVLGVGKSWVKVVDKKGNVGWLKKSLTSNKETKQTLFA